MANSSDWKFVGGCYEGEPFGIGGLDVWKHSWRDTGERVRIRKSWSWGHVDLHVYEINDGGVTVTFGAKEFANCAWGFYISRDEN